MSLPAPGTTVIRTDSRGNIIIQMACPCRAGECLESILAFDAGAPLSPAIVGRMVGDRIADMWVTVAEHATEKAA